MPRTPKASGTPLYQVRLDETSWRKVRAMIETISFNYGKAMEDLTPEFGAYMPYSIFQEIGRRSRPMRFIPHIAPAVFNNLDYILKRVMANIAVKAQKAAMTGKAPSISQARAEAIKLWEETLNALPREQAFARAPVEFGFHRASLAGYGQSPSDAQVAAWQRKWMKERAARRATIRESRRRQEAGRRIGVGVRLGALKK